MHYLLLAAAIVTEVIGTLALKASQGFTQLAPTVLVIAGYAASFVLLSQVLKLGIPLGTVYAIWASAGIALVAVAGAILFNEPMTPRAILGIAFIIGGVILVETGHATSGPPR